MATLWRLAAAVLFCAVCVAMAALESSPRQVRSAQPSPVPADSREAAIPSPPETRPAPAVLTHTVVTGETIWDIAASAGVGVEALAAANGLSENTVLRLGQVLTIHPSGAPVPQRLSVPRVAASARALASPPAAAVFGAARRLALLWPSSGIVTSRFGWRVHPIFGGPEFHTGMDIATRYGSPVVAARTGVVRFVGWKSGYGRIIVLAHDGGFETAYSHLSAAQVTPGQRVAEGQMIGRIGSSGWSTGPHLFFEVRRNGTPVDPARYLN